MKKPDSQEDPSAPAQPKPGRGLRTVVWSLPLGWQLSTLYALLLAVTLALVGTVVYTQQGNFLVQDTAGRLVQEATRITTVSQPPDVPSGKQNQPGGRGDQQGPGPGPSDFGPDRLMGNLVRGLSGPGVAVAILDSEGKVITSTQGLEGDTAPIVDPVSPERAASALQTNQPVQWIVKRPGGGRQVVVLMAVTLRSTGGPGGAQPAPTTLLLEQSASLAAADAALERLGTYLLIGVLGGTLVGILLVLLFTRAVLQPLDRVADTADAIAAGDLQRRLQLPPGRNEVARLGKAFDYMVSRLVATVEAQRRFVADASHEMRTPLTSLKGLAEVLMIGAHADDTRVIEQSASSIRSELDRLGRLVNDLLTLSRLDSAGGSAGPPTRRARMDVCATMQAVAGQMQPLAEGREVNLSLVCDGPVWTMGDASQIKQVLINLVDNAVRHTPAGGEVTLQGIATGGEAKIEVRDTGSGIDESDLPHIFERFYRGDSSRSRATGNSGLGLAIARGIVEAHGGSIEVASKVGSGTCFTLRLPLAQASATGSTEQQAETAAIC